MIINSKYDKSDVWRSFLTSSLLWLIPFLLLVMSQPAAAQFWKKDTNPLLPEEQAFSVSASILEDGAISVNWSIADDYYMYRDNFAIEAAVPLAPIQFPKGVIENDPEFGEVEVYFFNAELKSRLLLFPSDLSSLELTLKGQGCNKPVGVCYPPMTRTILLDLPSGLTLDGASSVAEVSNDSTPSTEQASALELEQKSFAGYMVWAFFAGLLLSFTPCVLPMIPILAGIIAGQDSPSQWRSGMLACCYVGGTIVTYIAAGALAGATGAQLQAWFQNVWVIGGVCALLVALALSLFGLYRIELPSSLQTKLNESGGKGRSAVLSSFTLGLISALVVGACVSPILFLALGTAISQGDPLLGGAMMGSMALGMGALLIAFGFGAGWLLPKVGPWMQHIQVLFGFMVLGVAIYLLGAFPAVPSLLLWGALFFVTAFYLWQMAANAEQPLMLSALRMLASILFVWGALALVGAASKGDDILQPLSGLTFASGSSTTQSSLNFTKTTTLSEVQTALSDAKANNQPVMVDFYADWCLDCKRMHRTTFKKPSVHAALEGWKLIEIDVTNTSNKSEEVKRHFDVFGPPATLFFNAQGAEHQALRQYGYINEQDFLALIARAMSS